MSRTEQGPLPGHCPRCGRVIPTPAQPIGQWGGVRPDGSTTGGGVYAATCGGCRAVLLAYHDTGGVTARPRSPLPALTWTETTAPVAAASRRFTFGRGARAVARATMMTGHATNPRRSEAIGPISESAPGAAPQPRKAHWRRLGPVERSAIVKLFCGEESLTVEELELLPAATREEAAAVRPRLVNEIATLLGVQASRVRYAINRERHELEHSADSERLKLNRSSTDGAPSRPTGRMPGPLRWSSIVKLSRGEVPLNDEELARLPVPLRAEAAVVRPRSVAEIATLLRMSEGWIRWVLKEEEAPTKAGD